jgi:hypothetical protein
MRSSFIGVAAVPVRLIALALLTRMSMPPNSRAAAAAAATAASSRAIGGATAGLFDLGRRGVNGSWQLRVRLDGLGGNGDVRAFARRAERDRETDAARAAGYE